MTSRVSLLSSHACWRQWTRCWQMTLPVWWPWFLRKPQTLLLKVWILGNPFMVFFILVLSECFVLFSYFLCALTSELFLSSIIIFCTVLLQYFDLCWVLCLWSSHSLTSLQARNIWGSLSSMVGGSSLLGNDSVLLGEWLSTFQRIVVTSFSFRQSEKTSRPWRWRQHYPLNAWEPLTQQHCITSWKTSVLISSSSLCIGTTSDI